MKRSTEEIGACFKPTPGNIELRGAYTVIKQWYLHASARATNPYQSNISKVTEKYVALYRRENPTPPWRPVPTHVTPFRVNGDVPL